MTEPPDFMLEALRLARDNIAAGGGPFGAVVVQGGVIIGRGANRVTATNDPTAHAEVVAIRDACARLGSFRLDGASIFSTCEPCPMCLGAILWARMAAIYYAAARDDAAAAGFDDAAFYREIGMAAGSRTIAEFQMHAGDGRAVLRAWQDAPNRRPY